MDFKSFVSLSGSAYNTDMDPGEDFNMDPKQCKQYLIHAITGTYLYHGDTGTNLKQAVGLGSKFLDHWLKSRSKISAV